VIFFAFSFKKLFIPYLYTVHWWSCLWISVFKCCELLSFIFHERKYVNIHLIYGSPCLINCMWVTIMLIRIMEYLLVSSIFFSIILLFYVFSNCIKMVQLMLIFYEMEVLIPQTVPHNDNVNKSYYYYNQVLFQVPWIT